MYSAFQNVLFSPVNNLTLSRPAAPAMWGTELGICAVSRAVLHKELLEGAEMLRGDGEDDNVCAPGAG